jgi:hypothetical protein
MHFITSMFCIASFPPTTITEFVIRPWFQPYGQCIGILAVRGRHHRDQLGLALVGRLEGPDLNPLTDHALLKFFADSSRDRPYRDIKRMVVCYQE